MKVCDIIALAKAGYTEYQISKLAALEDQALPEPKPQPAPEPKPKAAVPAQKPQVPKQEVPKPQPAPEPKPQPVLDYLAALSEQMEKLTATIQANGILGSSMPPEQDSYNILGNILRPDAKEVV